MNEDQFTQKRARQNSDPFTKITRRGAVVGLGITGLVAAGLIWAGAESNPGDTSTPHPTQSVDVEHNLNVTSNLMQHEGQQESQQLQEQQSPASIVLPGQK